MQDLLSRLQEAGEQTQHLMVRLWLRQKRAQTLTVR